MPQSRPECPRKSRLKDETSPVDASMRDSLRREGLLGSGKFQEAALGERIAGLQDCRRLGKGPQEGIFFEPMVTCKS